MAEATAAGNAGAGRLSLRLALLAPLLASLLIGSLGLGLFVHRAVEQDLVGAVDDELQRAAVSTRDRLRRPGPGAELAPGGTDAGPATDGTDVGDAADVAPIQAILDAEGVVIEAVGDASVLGEADLVSLLGGGGVVTVGDEARYRVTAIPLTPDRTLVIGLSLDGVDESLASLRRSLVVGGLVLVVLQSLVVAAVARLVTRPVVELSATAHRIAGGDLDADATRPSGPRETAALADDLQAMLNRLRTTIADREAAAWSAERARLDMERFMADASHELRTPLTALRGYSDLYRSGMLDEAGVATAMDRIGSESERLTRLVRDLLELVRPDGGHDERVDLGAVASAAVHDLRAAHPDFALTLHLDDEGPAAEVIGDPAPLHQAVLNLGANAWQHTPAGTPVEVVVSTHGAWVQLDVVDHGPGIDAAVAETLFEPFTRADRSRSRRSHDGAGLGLALVRRIADRHLGGIEVADTEGGGATFRLRLPAADGQGSSTNL